MDVFFFRMGKFVFRLQKEAHAKRIFLINIIVTFVRSIVISGKFFFMNVNERMH
jgi:hypothetical protein